MKAARAVLFSGAGVSALGQGTSALWGHLSSLLQACALHRPIGQGSNTCRISSLINLGGTNVFIAPAPSGQSRRRTECQAGTSSDLG